MDCKIFLIEFFDKFFNSNLFAAIAGGFSAGLFGFYKFKKQKNLERIDDKYFQKGIGGLIDYLNEIREDLEDNFCSTLMILRCYRDLEYTEFLEWLKKENPYSLKMVSSKMPGSFFVTSSFLRDNKFKRRMEELFAKLQSINDYYISDFLICLRKYNTTLDKKEFYNRLTQEATQRNQEMEDIYHIIGYLELILLEIRKLDISKYDDMEKISKNLKIVDYLNKIKEYEK